MSSDLTADHIRSHLGTRTLGQRLHLKAETDSTNADAVELARGGAPHGTVVVADHQTAGRGRLGRSWYSPPGCNLYCSILLRPSAGPEEAARWLSWIPLVAGVAAARACQQVQLTAAAVKWPNDILVREKKIGGVLCESTGLGRGISAVIVGIGMNVNGDPGTFPDELREQATSMAREAGHAFDRGQLLSGILAALEERLDRVESGCGGEVFEEYRTLCATLGRTVRVSLVGGGTLEGVASRIGPDGSLQILLAGSGAAREPVVVRSGDVVHVR